MPRKQASSTTLVKKVRNKTWAGNQRMQASSRNRIRMLIKNSSAPARKRLLTTAWRTLAMISVTDVAMSVSLDGKSLSKSQVSETYHTRHRAAGRENVRELLDSGRAAD